MHDASYLISTYTSSPLHTLSIRYICLSDKNIKLLYRNLLKCVRKTKSYNCYLLSTFEPYILWLEIKKIAIISLSLGSPWGSFIKLEIYWHMAILFIGKLCIMIFWTSPLGEHFNFSLMIIISFLDFRPPPLGITRAGRSWRRLGISRWLFMTILLGGKHKLLYYSEIELFM